MLRSSISGLICAFGATVLCVSTATAQRETVNQTAEWFAVTSNNKLNKRFSLMLDGQFRYVQAFDPAQFQLRTGIDIAITKNLSFMPLAYVYTWNEQYGKQPASFVNNEHRFFQQLVFKQHVGRFYLQHRARLEERFIQVHTTTNGEVINEGYHQKSHRYRYRFLANIPLNKPAMDPGAVYACVYDEIFMSAGKSVTFHQPDQNRIFVGVGYQFTKLASVQAGAFYQLLIKSNGTKQENNVGVQVQLTYNFDLSKQN